MEATTFLISTPKLPQRRPFSTLATPCRRTTTVLAFNGGGRNENSGGLVDENMIELRVRIREIKMVEACNNPPSHWMQWEKHYFQHCNYNNDVYEAVGLLQNFFLNVRPCLALGFVLLVLMSFSITTGVVFFLVADIAKMILTRLLVG